GRRDRRPERARDPAPPGADPREGVVTGIAPVRWDTDRLILVDQTLLPEREVERGYQSWQEVGAAIRALVVRGAPAIGVAAAFGVVLAARESRAATFDDLMADLATAGYGTALGVVRAAHEQGKVALVWVDETRPVMQGSRLTAWECVREGIPHRLIADVVAASVMARGEVDLVVTGADRIAAN